MSGIRNKINYKIFSWEMRTKDFEKTLKKVEEFINKPGITDVVSIMYSLFGIIVWYRAAKGFKVMLKKP